MSALYSKLSELSAAGSVLPGPTLVGASQRCSTILEVVDNLSWLIFDLFVEGEILKYVMKY